MVKPSRCLLIFHGYLLRGTGSNIYNAGIARALVRLGHDVHLLCQDPEPEALDFVDSVGNWQGGRLRVRRIREPRFAGRCAVYRPAIGKLLPVYVADRYEGFEARSFPDLSVEEVEAYVAANVAAVRDVARLAKPDGALANHLVMGPAILARALGASVPYAVKVHGSALEYTVKPNPRFLPYAREGLSRARAVLVGSRHTAQSLWTALDDGSLPARTFLGPPGVDVDLLAPRSPRSAAAGIARLADRLDGAAPNPLRGLDPERHRLVAYVGKLIVSKGVDLLLAAWPLVLRQLPGARLVIVGFGTYREALELLVRALATNDLRLARWIAERGRELEGGPHEPLSRLAAFLAGPLASAAPYRAAALALPGSVVFTGRLDHDNLADLLPACECLVVPSTFPEAFGMVAIEAAACGVWPVVARHSGLAEVANALAAEVGEASAALLTFETGGGHDPVQEIGDRVAGYLSLPAGERNALRRAARSVAERRWSWEQVAHRVVQAALGDLEDLPAP